MLSCKHVYIVNLKAIASYEIVKNIFFNGLIITSSSSLGKFEIRKRNNVMLFFFLSNST